jgi:hypothetical protein
MSGCALCLCACVCAVCVLHVRKQVWVEDALIMCVYVGRGGGVRIVLHEAIV